MLGSNSRKAGKIRPDDTYNQDPPENYLVDVVVRTSACKPHLSFHESRRMSQNNLRDYSNKSTINGLVLRQLITG